ncbi:winged helix-turn-helix domain-containing protein [Mangrovicoccus sp. HB161399]|uniref:winged helix-turn-helix domain-containing protein n=1 Tax=Mangrovicoccus sp. HB161399 TaxID=2720392 RepID=UPI001557F047|nr:winged helix-turn-helix domain-containing protein [Mangrovicoccus sp. HB161399]
MILSFADVEIDPDRGELRRGGVPVPAPARVPRLLHFLASRAGRIVTKDEIIAEVWDGRAVSENALSTLIKDARKAIGDDGRRQDTIRTQHGVGFRLVAPVQVCGPDAVPCGSPAPAPDPLFAGRPSIAVLRFALLPPQDAAAHLGVAIPAEIIAALSRLRSVSVTARHSSLRFETPAPEEIGRALGVRYCLSGSIEMSGRSLAVTVELARCADSVVIWADRICGGPGDVHDTRARIVAAVVNALEIHVPASEAEAARLRPPDSIDAWAEFHIGLQHLYRYNAQDNEIAKARFARAVAMEPGFARAQSGLAFSWFQTAFMGECRESREAVARATAHAERALELDGFDPFASYCMGRSRWAAGDPEEAQAWMQRSTDLCPSYAQGHYAHALMGALQGEGYATGQENEFAMALSPLDPLRYAMLGTQCHIAINEADYDRAADWGDQAALCPGAHYLLGMLAAAANQLKGDGRRARHWRAKVTAARPGATVSRFFGAFPYPDIPERQQIETALLAAGFGH